MNTREKFRYMAFGAALMFLGMLLTLMSPLTAQKDRFGEIECTKLTVVDGEGKASVVLTGEDGLDHVWPFAETPVPVVIYDRGIRLTDSNKESLRLKGGRVDVYDKDIKAHASLHVDDHGGRVIAFGKDWRSHAVLSISEYGGRVEVNSKGDGTAVMGINEFGNGAVSTWDKNGYRQ